LARKLTRAAALQNRAFLKILRKTGNVRLAAREVGAKYGTMQHRRKVHASFAVRWDAALAFAQAKLTQEWQSRHGSESREVACTASFASDRVGCAAGLPAGAVSRHNDARSAPLTLCSAASFRTAGGEPVMRRTRNGKLQMQRAQANKLTPAAEQAFLSALSATCNMSLAAAAAGACFGAFNRRRKKNPAFARECRLALAQGYQRLEMELLASTLADSHEHDDWRHNDPPPIPPMSANQALQLMYLNQKAALLLDEPTPMRRRRGETNEMRNERLAQMAEARDERHREEFEVAEVERWEKGEPAWGPAGEDVRGKLGLPDLAQVTGWSRADPAKRAVDPDTALFGGWRIEDMERKLGDEGFEVGDEWVNSCT
jgi:hypothetical protein